MRMLTKQWYQTMQDSGLGAAAGPGSGTALDGGAEVGIT